MFESINESFILNRMKQSISNGIDTAEGTFTHDLLSPSANEIARLYSQMDYAISQAFLVTAEGERLTNKSLEFGVERKDSQKAIGIVTFYGIAGTRIPTSTIVSTISGLQFETIEEATIISESVDVKVQAISAGEQYNIESYVIKSLNTSIGGVTKVENSERFVGGRLLETDEELRTRTFEKINYPSASGNAQHYRDWAYEVNGVGAVKVIPVWEGPGTVKVVIVDSNKKPANSALISEVLENIEENRPIGVAVTVDTATTVPFTLSISVKQFGSRPFDEIREVITEKVEAYVKEVAFVKETVSYNKIIAILESITEIAEYKDVKINNLSSGQDLALTSIEIPELERIDIYAYN